MRGGGLVLPREFLEIRLSLPFVNKKKYFFFLRGTPISCEHVLSTAGK